MVNLLVVYHPARWTDHSDILTRWKMVSNDDGTVCHWLWRWGLLAARAHVSRRMCPKTHPRSHGLVSCLISTVGVQSLESYREHIINHAT